MLENILEQFGITGKPEPLGEGHINSTFRAGKYVVQRINTDVFTNPRGVMDNVCLVTEHITKKLTEMGEDPSRQTLHFLRTKDGSSLYEGEEGAYRAYEYIDDAYTVNDEKTPEVLYQAALTIGKFQNLLSDFDAEKLFTVIPDFHNTPKRLDNLKKAIEKNASDRVKFVSPEIEFALSFENTAGAITDAIADGTAPLRVSHNDTKLNNVLFDDKTNKGICLIDLDTVMSGSYLYDFGDAMRFGASTAAEDCTELDKVHFDLALVEAFTKGYLESAKDVLTDREKELIFTSVILMTYECGTRFLTDYIDGDVYFKTAYANHNLDRAKNQYALVKDMVAKRKEAEAIVKKYL